MKKIAPIVAVVVLAATFTSCKKNYSCDCTDAQGNVTKNDLGKQKKTDAKEACDAANVIYSLGGGSCELN